MQPKIWIMWFVFFKPFLLFSFLKLVKNPCKFKPPAVLLLSYSDGLSIKLFLRLIHVICWFASKSLCFLIGRYSRFTPVCFNVIAHKIFWANFTSIVSRFNSSKLLSDQTSLVENCVSRSLFLAKLDVKINDDFIRHNKLF
jgi:hypothetical protein